MGVTACAGMTGERDVHGNEGMDTSQVGSLRYGTDITDEKVFTLKIYYPVGIASIDSPH